MNLNKFIQTLKEFMSKNKSTRGKQSKFRPQLLKLIPDITNDEDAQKRKVTIQKILSLMFVNLNKRGRPKKDCEENLNAA